VEIDDLIERYHLDPEYVILLGLAMYAFSRMEKQVVTCSDIIDPGSANRAYSNRHHNAENKRQELVANANQISDIAKKKMIDGQVRQYSSKTVDANGSIREHIEFSDVEVEEFVEECLECASELLDAIHGFLNDIYQWKRA